MSGQDCYQDIGELTAKVEMLIKANVDKEQRITKLEHEKTRLTTLGAVIAFILTSVGVFFADPIKAIFQKLIH